MSVSYLWLRYRPCVCAHARVCCTPLEAILSPRQLFGDLVTPLLSLPQHVTQTPFHTHTHTQTPSHPHGSAACLPPLVSPSHRTHRHSNAVTVRHLQSHTQYTSRSSNILHLPLKVDAKPSQLMIFDH